VDGARGVGHGGPVDRGGTGAGGAGGGIGAGTGGPRAARGRRGAPLWQPAG
jgi:hypothetical protein